MLIATLAFASTTFPSAVEQELSMPCRAACTVCHATLSGGSGTVTQPFGIALMERGLVGGDDALLADTLAAMEADGVDSDGDGQPDTEALAVGVDPNDGADFCNATLPKYGCFSGAASALLLLPFAAFLRRR